MWVKIESITTQKKTSKNGRAYQSAIIKGTKIGYGGEPDAPYQREIPLIGDGAEAVKKIKEIGIGNVVDIKSTKTDSGWVTSVASVNKFNKKSSQESVQKKAQEKPAAKEVSADDYDEDDDDEISITKCYELATQLMCALINRADVIKLIKPKITIELLASMCSGLANALYTSAVFGEAAQSAKEKQMSLPMEESEPDFERSAAADENEDQAEPDEEGEPF